jgi:integrase
MDSTPNYMNQDDFDAVIRAIPILHIRKWLDSDVEYLFKILYHMALRPSEGIKREKKDFDIKNRMVYLGKTKTNNNDKAVIPKIFVDELELWLSTKEEGRLFPDLKYITFWTWLSKLGLMLDIDAWKPDNRKRISENTKGHIFRKSWGKDALENKVPVNVISKHLRHKKPSMTIDYYLKSDIKNVFDTI